MILPREIPTATNKAPVVRAMAALLMVVAILSAVTRFAVRLTTLGTMKADDYLLSAATLLAIFQSLCVIIQGANGFGKHADVLSSDQFASITKAGYAAETLFIAVVLLTKISATRTIMQMAPRNRLLSVVVAEVVCAAWAVAAIVTILFQCPLPEPWYYIGRQSQCINRGKFWVVIDITNIITDLGIIGITMELFRGIQTSRAKKVLVMCVFSSRIFIVPASVSHIYYYYATADSADPTFDLWLPTICMQVVQCMSILTTCVPHLKPFIDSLESGQMQAGGLIGTQSKCSASRSKGSKGSGQRSRTKPRSKGLLSTGTLASNASSRHKTYEMVDMDKSDVSVERQPRRPTAAATASYDPTASWDSQSHTSQTVLVQNSWRVDIERKHSATGSYMDHN